jgi:signal peptidase I
MATEPEVEHTPEPALPDAQPAQEAAPAPSPATPFAVLLLAEIRGWVRDIVLAVGAAILIVVFLYQPVKVEGTSMLPELVDQERIFVNKYLYHFEQISRKDIVVFWFPKDPSKRYIKRVIGMPGDTVEIKDGVVYVNGARLEESYLIPEYRDHRSNPPVTVESGHYFVLGDHRDKSNDSRNWGLVPEKYIYGKAVFRYWPVTKIGALD